MQLRTLFRTPAREAELADAVQSGYSRWRQETRAVAQSYRSWLAAPRDERWLAYAAYMAALEREERAAGALRRLAERTDTPSWAR